MCSIIWCTALTLTSPFWKSSSAQRHVRNTANGSAAFDHSTSILSALSGGYQLQQLLWVLQPFFELGTQCLGRNLRCDRNLTRRGIGGNEFHFVDANAGLLA